jgi:hypothetical protein
VEAGSNTSTVALRVVKGDGKGIQCLGLQPGHPVPGGYKYGGLPLKVGGVSMKAIDGGERSASCPSRFTPWELAPSIHQI